MNLVQLNAIVVTLPIHPDATMPLPTSKALPIQPNAIGPCCPLEWRPLQVLTPQHQPQSIEISTFHKHEMIDLLETQG